MARKFSTAMVPARRCRCGRTISRAYGTFKVCCMWCFREQLKILKSGIPALPVSAHTPYCNERNKQG